jgi:hypothetical protein
MENQIEIYTNLSGNEISVNLKEETIWMSQKQIALLFGTEIPAIKKHIKNIFDSNELQPTSTISKMEIVQTEGRRTITNVH